MSATVTWFGLDELRAELRRMPEELTGEADKIVHGAANGAAFALRTAYAAHRDSGNMQEHVFVTEGTHDRYGAGYLVKAAARHSHLFEFGSHGSRSYTGTDKRGRKFNKADRGEMPGANIFIPTMIRERNRMFRLLIAMMRRVTGCTEVSGSVAA